MGGAFAGRHATQPELRQNAGSSSVVRDDAHVKVQAVVVGVQDPLVRRMAQRAITRLRPRVRIGALDLLDSDVHGSLVAIVMIGAEHARPLAVASLRNAYPGAKLVACLTSFDPLCRQLSALARAGLDSVVFADGPDAADELARTVVAALRHSLDGTLFRTVNAQEMPLATNAVSWVLRNAHRRLRATEVADWFQVDQGTLNRSLRRIGLPNLHLIVAGSRLLHLKRSSPPRPSAQRRLRGNWASLLQRHFECS